MPNKVTWIGIIVFWNSSGRHAIVSYFLSWLYYCLVLSWCLILACFCWVLTQTTLAENTGLNAEYIPSPMMWILLTKPMQKSVTTVCSQCSFVRLKNKHVGVLGTNVATMSWLHWSPVLGIEWPWHGMGCQKRMAVAVSRFKYTAVSHVSHFINLIVSHMHLIILWFWNCSKNVMKANDPCFESQIFLVSELVVDHLCKHMCH